MTDLILINPGNRHQVYQSLGNDLAAIEPPVWTGLMATFVRKHGITAEIIDANATGASPGLVAELVEELNPRFVGIPIYGHQPSASTQVLPAARDIAIALKNKNPKRPIIMLGGHVAALSEQTLLEEPIDFTAVGEGLWTLVYLSSELNSLKYNLDNVPGLCYFKNGQVVKNKDVELVTDLDGLMPTLPWESLPMHLYRAHNWHCFGGFDRKPYAAIYTTLGCVYHCSFCTIQAPFRAGEKAAGMSETRNSYRYWSPKVVGDTLQTLVEKYNVRNVKFADEMFILNRRHVEGICDEIINRKLDLSIWAYARVDTVKDGMLPKLKKAGFKWLAFGIESGNADVQRGIDKEFNHNDMMNTLEEVRKFDINVGANYIFGLPDDNYKTMQQTLDLALEINAEYANFYSCMAYTGSPLYAQAIKEGWDLPKSWSGYSQHSVDSHPLPTRYLKSSEIIAFRDKAFQTYFTNPRYLEMMQKKFGIAAINEINQMLEHKLERKK